MSLKKSFSSDGKKCSVEFTVNVNAAAGAEKVYLVGEWRKDKTTDKDGNTRYNQYLLNRTKK